LHVLPNDPALRDLTPIQALWVVGNVVQDAEQLERESPSSGGAAVTKTTEVATELSDEEFQDYSAQARAAAEVEAKLRVGTPSAS
jgi:hypothetical protein